MENVLYAVIHVGIEQLWMWCAAGPKHTGSKVANVPVTDGINLRVNECLQVARGGAIVCTGRGVRRA